MKKNKSILLFLSLALALIVSACAPATQAVQNTPSVPETGVEVTPMGVEDVWGRSAAFLGDVTGVGVDRIEQVEINAVEWSDSCLGLGSLNESCLAAVTPGYEVVATIDGEVFRIRTNQDASAIRLDNIEGVILSPAEGIAPEEAAQAALGFLTQTANVQIPQVALNAVTAEDWPDACLGLANADESCAQMITPGFRFSFMVDGQTYEVRTDASGGVVRMAPLN